MPSPTTAARALRGASAPGLWLVLGVVAAAACKDDDAEPTVEEIVEASARHESHLLELLEANVSRPDEARRLIAEYVATNA
ncbi:hypothetical protein L6R46_30040, partial [Myxococcota bacterium]|nr:hypothetical protein [Myxococcota bacterium]